MRNKKVDLSNYDIRAIYLEMELELIRSMKSNLKRHQEEELKQGFKFEQWQSAKLRDLERFRKENEKIIGKYSDPIEELLSYTLVDTYRKSQGDVNQFIKEIKNVYIDNIFVRLPGDLDTIFQKPIEDEAVKDIAKEVLENIRIWQEASTPIDEVFFRTNDEKFNALMETVERDFNKANAAVLRRMDDVYRQTIFKAQVHYNTGTVSLDQAVDMATKDFLSKGIDAITYKDGKKVNIASYAEMALRTANHRAYLMAEGKKRQELGLSLVVVSAHATACGLCVPWQGLILIDDVYGGGTQADGSYQLLSTAMDKGLMHPNCRHNLSTYFPGITTLPQVPDPKKVLANYEQEQKQRHIERQIRKYKRLKEGSISEKDVKDYDVKVKEWQNIQRDHLKENQQLRRAYRKEQTKGIPFDYGQKYEDLKDVITQNNITIKEVSHHLKLRATERKIPSRSIENALINPLSIGKIRADNTKQYVGEYATVAVNTSTGNITTVWPTSKKKAKRLKRSD